MVALNIVLRNGAVVFDPFLCQEIRGIGLLQKSITHILFVPKNLIDGAGVPFCITCPGENAVSHKAFTKKFGGNEYEIRTYL